MSLPFRYKELVQNMMGDGCNFTGRYCINLITQSQARPYVFITL